MLRIGLKLNTQLPYDEVDILRQISAGDEQAFKQLMKLYGHRFLAVAVKMTRTEEAAKDMVQEVFMSIWQNRESLAEVVNPSSYFFTVLYRRIYRHFKKVALEKKLLENVSGVAVANSTEEIVLARESNKLIIKAVSKLPPQQQLIFRLVKQEGLSREDIAQQLKISPHTVRNHLAEAVRFIRNFLRESALIFIIIFCLLKK